jgi:16S rRNA (adenine1518-N6/adenine1519-N6)-dimethyltransferase
MKRVKKFKDSSSRAERSDPVKKSLGQHWLRDAETLNCIADAAELTPDDTVLEIGPGRGDLTRVLAARAGRVVAVEFDKDLIEPLRASLPGSSRQSNEKRNNENWILGQAQNDDKKASHSGPDPESSHNIEIVHDDILKFDLSTMPKNYKVAANVPYYITSPIVEKLLAAENRPAKIVLLVQKEVAERLARTDSVLGVFAHVYADVELGRVVPAEMFSPPPKVDSEVVILTPKNPEFSQINLTKKDWIPERVRNDETDAFTKKFWRVVKAGYGERRKKLRSSLSGGLGLEKTAVEKLLRSVGVSPDARAENVSIEEWAKIAEALEKC